MKLYIWKNDRTDSDFEFEDNMFADHSACLVVLARNKEVAKEFALSVGVGGEPVELDPMIPSVLSGIVVHAAGEC